MHHQRQPNLLDELGVGDDAAVLAQHPLNQCGLVGIEA